MYFWITVLTLEGVCRFSRSPHRSQRVCWRAENVVPNPDSCGFDTSAMVMVLCNVRCLTIVLATTYIYIEWKKNDIIIFHHLSGGWR